MRPGIRWLLALALLLAGCGVAPGPQEAASYPEAPPAPASAPAPAGASASASPAASAAGREAIGFRTPRALSEHFRKHGAEFRAASPEEYLALAQALRDRPAGGELLEIVRGDGVITRYDRGSGAFIAFERDGVIRTFFVPNDGERYFQRQATRRRR